MLRQIFDKHKCDKGSLRHRYDRVYEPVLEKSRYEKLNIFEIGILRGDSIKSWLEYLPEAELFGIDIFKRVPSELIDTLCNERVHWCKCDSIAGVNDDFKRMVGDIEFDVIIDDGLHFPSAQRQTFENFMPYLTKDGVYFIEDVWPLDILTKEERAHRWLKKHPDDYSDIEYNKLLEALILYDITFHDLREDTEPDSVIIEVRHK